MGRPLRIIQTEFPYHIMTQTNNKEFHLKELPGKKVLKIFVSVLNEAIRKYKIKVFHFVLMDNHYHLIIRLTEPNLHRALQYINAQLARKINKLAGRCGHLWKDRYKSSIIQNEEYYSNCVRYIYENPVRAKISDSPFSYERSSISFYAFGKKVEVEISPDDILVLKFGNSRENISRYFMELFDAPETLNYKRVAYLINRPIMGDERFEKYINDKFKPGTKALEQNGRNSLYL